MFHTVAYSAVTAQAAALADLPAVSDTILTVRNSHLIFTDDFLLRLAYGLGSSQTLMRFNTPTLNAYFRHQLWPFDFGGATPGVVPDRPAIIDYGDMPIKMPENEEIAIEVSNASGVGGERNSVFLWLFTADHQFAVPKGIFRGTARATYSITPAAAGAWSGASAFTFAENLRGGWYSVVGFNVFDASTLAARLIFPRARQYDGRVLRPGTLAQNAGGNRPDRKFDGGLGVYGVFHSFEPVQVEILSNTAALHTGECRLDLVYHGDSPPAGFVGG